VYPKGFSPTSCGLDKFLNSQPSARQPDYTPKLHWHANSRSQVLRHSQACGATSEFDPSIVRRPRTQNPSIALLCLLCWARCLSVRSASAVYMVSANLCTPARMQSRMHTIRAPQAFSLQSARNAVLVSLSGRDYRHTSSQSSQTLTMNGAFRSVTQMSCLVTVLLIWSAELFQPQDDTMSTTWNWTSLSPYAIRGEILRRLQVTVYGHMLGIISNCLEVSRANTCRNVSLLTTPRVG